MQWESSQNETQTAKLNLIIFHWNFPLWRLFFFSFFRFVFWSSISSTVVLDSLRPLLLYCAILCCFMAIKKFEKFAALSWTFLMCSMRWYAYATNIVTRIIHCKWTMEIPTCVYSHSREIKLKCLFRCASIEYTEFNNRFNGLCLIYSFFYVLRACYIHVYAMYKRVDCEFLNFMLSLSLYCSFLLLLLSFSFFVSRWFQLEKGYVFNELFVCCICICVPVRIHNHAHRMDQFYYTV